MPLGIANLVLVARVTPADLEFRRRPFDSVGFVLMGITLATLLSGFDALVQHTLPVIYAVTLLIVAAVGRAGRWRRSNGIATPAQG